MHRTVAASTSSFGQQHSRGSLVYEDSDPKKKKKKKNNQISYILKIQ